MMKHIKATCHEGGKAGVEVVEEGAPPQGYWVLISEIWECEPLPQSLQMGLSERSRDGEIILDCLGRS